LRRGGVQVDAGLLETEAREINAGYFAVQELGRPRVSLKLAASLDGRVAPARGPARWITGPEARRAAHHLRARHDTVLVGAGTLRRDDPELTVREAKTPGGRQPLRVIVSGDLDLPASARVLGRALAPGTVVATIAPEDVPRGARGWHERRAARLVARGAEVWFLPGARTSRVSRAAQAAPGAQAARGTAASAGAGVDLGMLLARLAQQGRQDVLVEGGPRLAASFAERGLVDDVWLFLAPVLLGGAALPWGFGDAPVDLAGAWRLDGAVSVPVGRDWVIHGRPGRLR
jgi:diaminohydroxyphosphoribosylaminopyrimidine deaminase/5-amino-6-(5-phosphoribosylamino)uracil reductase